MNSWIPAKLEHDWGLSRGLWVKAIRQVRADHVSAIILNVRLDAYAGLSTGLRAVLPDQIGRATAPPFPIAVGMQVISEKRPSCMALFAEPRESKSVFRGSINGLNMPHLAVDDYSWHGSDSGPIQSRVLAAVVLVAVGWATGFFAGRMSAWVFPVLETDRPAPAAIAQTLPPPTSHADTSAPRAEEKQKTAAATSTPDPSPPLSERRRSNETASAAPNRESSNTDLAAPEAGQSDDQGHEVSPQQDNGQFALINPEWQRRRAGTRSSETPADDDESVHDRAALAKCERRYSSFRRSDGTYQPYGRSSRELCPYLR